MSNNNAGYEQMLRKEFGNMMPRSGVYFMPDFKVIAYIRLLNDYRRKCERELRYQEAKRAREQVQILADTELRRQKQNMDTAQMQEFEQIQTQQRAQFIEFSRAWDQYMAEYESAASGSVSNLREKQAQELEALRLKMYSLEAYQQVKYTLSKELMHMRAQEKLMFQVKEYDRAEAMRKQGDIMEQRERQVIQEQSVRENAVREEKRLLQGHEAQVKSLLKRIQRDRDEQVKQRMADSQRLSQRNKNVLKDLQQKQTSEQKKTMEFLKYALSDRPPGDFVRRDSSSNGHTLTLQVSSTNQSINIHNGARSGANMSLLSINTKSPSKRLVSDPQGRSSMGDILTFNPTPQNVSMQKVEEEATEAVKKLFVYNNATTEQQVSRQQNVGQRSRMGNHESPYGESNSALARQYNQLKSKQTLIKLQSNKNLSTSHYQQHNTYDQNNSTLPSINPKHHSPPAVALTVDSNNQSKSQSRMFDPTRFSEQAARNIKRAHNAIIRYHSLINKHNTGSTTTATTITAKDLQLGRGNPTVQSRGANILLAAVGQQQQSSRDVQQRFRENKSMEQQYGISENRRVAEQYGTQYGERQRANKLL
ncbi:hypothetical protein FGO68_gene2327 [Halteria grandinella]|uniref:Uncharacterized protein n=1 Tax=Halteria grandinella TaxID=5974 RepID=A0A8J8P4X5_HALGN|nr:hypothetical protein FGO68_gene2327 [Halteria grandinella]